MKRAGNLFDAIADWNNLRLAAAKALRGKRGKADAQLYVAAKEERRVPGYVRYMDDMALWSDTTGALASTLQAVQAFLADRLQLVVKPSPYLNRTGQGMDFLGLQLFPTHVRLNARSKHRFRRKFLALDRAFLQGRLSEREAQQRSQALIAFRRTPRVKSWCFRPRAIEQTTENDQGLGSRTPRRELEQQRQELPVGLPQQERAGQPEPEQRLPPGRSSNEDGSPAGTGRSPVPSSRRANDAFGPGW